MLGKNHAVMGAATWLTAVAVVQRTESLAGYRDLILPETSTAGNIARVGLSTIVAAGAAVLPDLDEPEATAARTFGFVGRKGSKALRWFAGGHRQRTHTLLFAGLMSLLGWWAAGIWHPGSPSIMAAPSLLLIGICSVWGFMLVGRAAEDRGVPARISTPVAWVLGSVATLLAAVPLLLTQSASAWTIGISEALMPRWWLPAVLGVGCVAHLLGDIVTKTGVPVFWPLSSARLKFGWFKVGSTGEQMASVVIAVWTIVAATLVFSGG